MIVRRILVGAALLLVGCVQRDNPFDPVNNPLERQTVDTSWAPVPHDKNLVLLPESSSRVNTKKYSYYSNIQSALSYTDEGDTLWIRGGREYLISGRLVLSRGGSVLNPIVIRSYGGIATIRNPPDKDGNHITLCLEIEGSYVKIVGVTVLNCETGIFAQSLGGPITLDSVRVENTSIALDLQKMKGKIKLHHIRLVNNVQEPPYLFAGTDSLDTLDFSWTPRSDSAGI